ncbi:AP2 domain-containing protein [Pseudomaricurvus alkylphenolicus]|jgi:hypothetical protein|uniref:AP2 domain-containing protein n=1 Tax=Pseudomaricurvus alkylphenolicus TaxID=1306991 RepID=UPI00141F8296|nr:AP2 domain-containing protein [Pseudomaricurvus alkylphenolicus]NIB42384.1 AP2 domain-containing protein [Pseudomaricurvus alkylphenolicus]
MNFHYHHGNLASFQYIWGWIEVKKKSKVMYGISRIDDDSHNTHAWRVSLRRNGKTHVKNFPDKKCGGKRKALNQAKEYRDEFIASNPPMTRQEFSSIKRRNNTSGVTGVCRFATKTYLADGTERLYWSWEASWPTTRGESESVRFSEKKYGAQEAFEKAVEAREKGIKKLTGVFWAAERGELA